MERREGDNDMSAIAMPGFIDILSTVIIMFVFFVTVIAVMLYVHMIKYKSTLEQETKAKVQQEVQATVAQLESQATQSPNEQIEQLKEDKAKLEEKVKSMEAELKQVKPDFAVSTMAQRTLENAQDKSLVVFFDRNAITIHPDTEAVVKAFITKYMGAAVGTGRLQITSPLNPQAPTAQNAKQLGLARMLNSRNVLIQQKVQQNNVLINFTGAEAVEQNYNWIRIKVE